MLKFIRALLGDVDSQLMLAKESWYGPEGKRNLNRALFWAHRACRKAPYPENMLLAVILNSAGEAESSNREMFRAIDRGAREGDKDAEYMLGRCYEDGMGVAKDLDQALHWYTTAGLNGSDEAHVAIASLYARGLIAGPK